MEDIILAAASTGVWAFTSRALFRHWVRNDTLSRKEDKCSHGYRYIHDDESCHGNMPLPHGEVALWAILAGLVLPVVLFVLFVVRNTPVSVRENAEKVAALEAENSELRRRQER